ncbi:M28 family peptidase [Pelomyxa schiedti]|nr:M28 family peptidase [Pelomyxa schiedti]
MKGRALLLKVGFAALMLAFGGLIVAMLAIDIERYVDDNNQPEEPPTDVTDTVSETMIRANLMHLSDESMEGRGAGSRGESLAELYVESQLAQWEIAPGGFNGSYYQDVPLQEVTPTLQTAMLFEGTSGTWQLSFSWYNEYLATTQVEMTDSTLVDISSANVVFVGYGIVAPEMGWNDYSMNVEGKVVIALLGQPTAGLWTNQSYLYYSLWDYKVEEAGRQKAKAIFVVDEPTIEEWSNVESDFGTSYSRLSVVSGVSLLGWMAENRTAELATLCGTSLDQWYNDANSGEVPQTLPATVSASVTFDSYSYTATNVIGILEGRSDEYVVLVAHIDGMGIVNGVVYPSAIDNGAGCSTLLSIAYAFSETVLDERNRGVIFLFPTAEELGLLGSEYFVTHLPEGISVDNLVAAISLDGGNLWGLTADFAVIGTTRNNLAELFTWAAEQEEMFFKESPIDPSMYYHSDHFSFAKQGVPSVMTSFGTEYENQPSSYFYTVVVPELFGCYHQVCDAYDPSWTMSGMAQTVNVVTNFAYALAYESYQTSCISMCL